MKKIFTLVVLALLALGCAKEYDDSGLRELIAGLDARISELETSISSLQSAIGDAKFVRKVEEYKDPDTGRTTGITVTYTDGNVVHFNIVPTDPSQGPVFSVIRNGAGDLCWAVDGVIIKVGGEDVPVYQTPVFSIDEEGNLIVEVEGQQTNLGPVKSEGATLQDGIFTNLAVTDNAVVLTLADGSTVNIPFAEAFQLVIDKTEYVYSGSGPVEIPYIVSAKTAGTVVGTYYDIDKFSVAVDADKIVVTPLVNKASGMILAYADSKVGLTSIVSLVVEAEGIRILDTPYSATVDYLAEGEDGAVVANAVSNVEFDVKPVDSWIHLVSVKSQAYVISLKLDDNKTGAVREGKVNIVRKGTDDVIQTIVIAQLPMQEETGAKNLSKKGSANSYIVSEAGEYKFAAVKGNSEESVGAVAKAEILWETDNTTTAPAVNSIIASVGVEDGFITFTTPEILKPGNALIAAKDAAGVILWSWHIWIPATEIISSTFGGVVGVPMMDRNLGALVAAAPSGKPDGTSIGMMYQWGRKDPFPGTASVDSSDPIATTGEVSLESEKQNFSIAESIQNPTVYVKTGGDSNKTWIDEKSNDLWGKTKTVYDPCPPGYIVSTRDKSWAFWGGMSSATGFVADTDNKQIRLGVDFDAASPETTGYVVIPICGYLDQGEYCKVGVRAYIWSCYASSGDMNIAYQVYINGSSISTTEQRMSRGGNIRCVVEVPAE